MTRVDLTGPWTRESACRDNPEAWTGTNIPRAERDRAKEICRTECPVFEQCKAAGAGEDWHIWAGEDKNAPVHGYDVDGAALVHVRANGAWYREPVKGKPKVINADIASSLAVRSGKYTLGLPGGRVFDDLVKEKRSL